MPVEKDVSILQATLTLINRLATGSASPDLNAEQTLTLIAKLSE